MSAEEIIQTLLRRATIDDPDQQALIARTMTRAIELSARAAAGEDVEAEIKIVEATALNLTEFVRQQARSLILGHVQNQILAALTRMALV